MADRSIHDPVAAMAPLASAILAHHETGDVQQVRFERSDGLTYEQSTRDYFECPEGLHDIDDLVLELATGRVLDIGAAAGRHCLELQAEGITCTGMDVHPDLVRVMTERGVMNTRVGDAYALESGQWDTITLLMDTIGIVGTLAGFDHLFHHLHTLLAPSGTVVINGQALSTDAEVDFTSAGAYPGEVTLRMAWNDAQGPDFPWLYLDVETLVARTEALGWTPQILLDDLETDHYVARLLPAQ